MIKSEEIKVVRNFVAAIIHQSVYDCCKQPNMRPEIRDFFKSQYGQELCETINLSAKVILAKLEDEKVNKRYLKEVS